MNKAELIEKLAAKTGLTKADSERILNATVNTIKDRIKTEDTVTLVGFGTFSRTSRKARSGVNPRTNEPMDIPASVVPKFKAGKAFLEYLN